jgi:amidase
VGTETDGSITCPSAINGLVGIKPTVGLVSRTYVVPISHSQDTPGPMTRTVEDAAILLTVMAGTDPMDPATADADKHKQDYAKALDAGALKGKRIGVLHPNGRGPEVTALYDKALAELKAAGAELVDIDGQFKDRGEIGRNELPVLLTELKADLNAYLASTPAQVKTRTLADVIAFDAANANSEMPFFAQELFDQAEKTKGLDDADYKKARETSLRLAGPEGIDRVMTENKLDAIVAVGAGPAWRTDVVDGDSSAGSGGPSEMPAVAGYPHLSVPMGQVRGLPVGISFIGRAWSEAQLLALGYAYEQRTHARKAPNFTASVEETLDAAAHLKPAK